MFIKIIIISGILLIGLAVFSAENDNIFSTASGNVINSMKENVGSIGDKTTKSIENRLDSSVKLVDEKTTDINNQIIGAKESSQKFLAEKISKINILDNVGKNLKNDTKIKSLVPTTNPTNNDSTINLDASIKTVNSNTIVNENLSLSSIQQVNGDVLLQYFDATGNTVSANVIIRTSDKEIFSGTFYTSNFKTVINNVSGTPYYMDVIVDHKDFGTVKSSIFNSGTNVDYKIIGMFGQP